MKQKREIKIEEMDEVEDLNERHLLRQILLTLEKIEKEIKNDDYEEDITYKYQDWDERWLLRQILLTLEKIEKEMGSSVAKKRFNKKVI